MLTRVQPLRRPSLGLTTSGEIAAIGKTAVVIPVVGPIIAGVTQILGALGVGNGCGQTCITATQYANAAQSAMEANLNAAQQTVQEYGCLTPVEVQQLTTNWQNAWNGLVAGCQSVPGTPGQNCISQRASGGEYDYQKNYLAPIQAMPVCSVSVASPVPTSSSTTTQGQITGTAPSGVTYVTTPVPVSASDTTPLLLIAAALGAIVLLR